MILKATIKCSCGAKYELFSSHSHSSVVCPNCSKAFIESDKLIEMFKIAETMKIGFMHNEHQDNNDIFNVFNNEDLVITSVE